MGWKLNKISASINWNFKLNSEKKEEIRLREKWEDN